MFGMKTIAVVFPFDLFGSAGSGAGAELLSDALRDMISDSRRERGKTRGHAYQENVRIHEFNFETMDDLKVWRKTGRQAARQAWKQGDFLLWLGGNHLGVLPVYEELGAETLVLQLDGHLDIYNLSDCTEELSHGNFLLHAEGPLPRIITAGHRDLFLPVEHIQRHYEKVFSAADVVTQEGRVLTEIAEAARKAKHIFLDIDCDVFDPAYFPGTTHSLPFGLAPSFVLKMVHAIGVDRLCGMAISEFAPNRDAQDQSLSTLIWLMEWMLLRLYESEPV
jgi:agmatinase